MTPRARPGCPLGAVTVVTELSKPLEQIETFTASVDAAIRPLLGGV